MLNALLVEISFWVRRHAGSLDDKHPCTLQVIKLVIELADSQQIIIINSLLQTQAMQVTEKYSWNKGVKILENKKVERYRSDNI